MPKIAHLVTTFYPGMTWAPTLLLAEDQRRQGWQVEFVAGYHGCPDFVKETKRRGFPVTQIPSLKKYIHPWKDLKALTELAQLLKSKKPDLVHTHLAKAGILGRLAARQAGVKNIFHTVYGPTFAKTLPFWRRWPFWAAEKYVGKFTSQFIFVGQDLRSSYLRSGVCSQENSLVIYGAKNLEPFIQSACLSETERRRNRQAFGLDHEAPIIGYVARIVPSKGHMYALRAFQKLKSFHQSAKRIIVGDARVPSEHVFKNSLVAKIKKLGLQEEIIFTGWLNEKETAHYYGLFDILIFPSIYEGLPVAVLEAMAADIPVVGFDCGGVRELLGDDPNLVPVKDTEALTAVLGKEIARVSERRRQRGKNLRKIEILNEFFSIERMVEETRKLYQTALSN